MQNTLTIATRESRLALWQAEHVRALLRERFGLAVELLGMTTRGDQILDKTLSKVGGKGLFVKELETALEEGRAHMAVHSLKDVPMDLPAGFVLAAVLEREDPRDAFVSNKVDTLTALAVEAERAVSRALGGSCSMPLAAHAEWQGERLRLSAALGALDADLSRPLLHVHLDAAVSDEASARALGERAAAELRAQGGDAYLASAGW